MIVTRTYWNVSAKSQKLRCKAEKVTTVEKEAILAFESLQAGDF